MNTREIFNRIDPREVLKDAERRWQDAAKSRQRFYERTTRNSLRKVHNPHEISKDIPQQTGGILHIVGKDKRTPTYNAPVSVSFYDNNSTGRIISLDHFVPQGSSVVFNPTYFRKAITANRRERIIYLPNPKYLDSSVFPFLVACAQVQFPFCIPPEHNGLPDYLEHYRSVIADGRPLTVSKEEQAWWSPMAENEKKALIWTLSVVSCLRHNGFNLLREADDLVSIQNIVLDPTIQYLTNDTAIGISQETMQTCLGITLIDQEIIFKAIKGDYIDDFPEIPTAVQQIRMEQRDGSLY